MIHVSFLIQFCNYNITRRTWGATTRTTIWGLPGAAGRVNPLMTPVIRFDGELLQLVGYGGKKWT